VMWLGGGSWGVMITCDMWVLLPLIGLCHTVSE
jgi:hypothetical protein